MPVLNPKDISEVRHGDMEIGSLFVGEKLMYNKRHLVEYLNAGTYKFLVPRWAHYVSVIAKGAGGGGSAGGRTPGVGGYGGKISAFRFSFPNSNMRYAINLTVGAGGLGGSTPGAAGKDGGASYWRYSDNTNDRADGGAGSDSSSQNGTGGFGYSSISDILALHLLREEGSRYYPGQGGTGNSGSGRYGGGGAGGNGGNWSGYSIGGRGGDGFVSICCWGIDPRLPKLTGGG